MKKAITVLLITLFLAEQSSVLAVATTNNSNNISSSNERIRTQATTNMYNQDRKSIFNRSSNRARNEEEFLNENFDDSMIYLELKPEEKHDAFANNFQTLNKMSRLSPIEQMFNPPTAEKTGTVLKQIGYDFFTPQGTTGTNTTGKFDNNYKLNIGEKVNVYLYGDSVDIMAISGSNLLTPVIKSEVDSKGSLFVSGIGPVSAENRTISEVESSINNLAHKKYKSLKVKVTIASGQDFSVFVYGQVNRPGKVLLSNNSSFADAIGEAGGIKKTGSLRTVKYTSGKKTRVIDLYKTLLTANGDDIILKANDKIFIEPIGDVVAIKNGVSVPGIYEAKQGESLQKLVNYAGGLLPGTQATDVLITSLNSTTKERIARNVAWANSKTIKIQNGDSVEFKGIYNDVENIVTLQGNVKHPATFAYKKGMRLSDVLKSEKELLEETFLSQAVIRRVSGPDNTIETIPVFLKEFFAGTNDPLLQPKDIINIYKSTNALFVDVYGCVSNPKHITYTENMRLDDILTDIRFVESTIPPEQNDKNVKNVTFKQGKDAIVLEAGTSKDSRLLSAEDIAVEISRDNEDTQVYYLYDIMVNSNLISTIRLQPNDRVFFRTLRDNEVVKSVKVAGFVRNPGVFKFIDGKRLTDMIEMAGGLTKDADLRGTVYKRKSVRLKQIEVAKKNYERDIKLIEGRMASQYGATEGSMEARQAVIDSLKNDRLQIAEKYDGQIALNIKTMNDLEKIKDIDNLYVQDGDEIYIPRIPTHINVIGEVYNEMSFVYVNGSKAKKYIKEIGGYTPNANRFKLYRISVNGRAERIRKTSKVEPGDTIVVPRKVAGNEWIDPISKALAAIANVAIAVIAVMNIKK